MSCSKCKSSKKTLEDLKKEIEELKKRNQVLEQKLNSIPNVLIFND